MNTKKIQSNKHVVPRERPDPSTWSLRATLCTRHPSAGDKRRAGNPRGKAGARAAQRQGRHITSQLSPHAPDTGRCDALSHQCLGNLR